MFLTNLKKIIPTGILILTLPSICAGGSFEANYQTAEQSRDTDRKLAYDGLPKDRAVSIMDFQEKFGELTQYVLENYQGKIARMHVDPIAKNIGYISFINDVPTDVLQTAMKLGLQKSVDIQGGGKITLEEKHKLASLVAKSLNKKGYDNLAAYYDVFTETVVVELKIPPQSKTPTEKNILTLIQSDINSYDIAHDLKSTDEHDFKITITQSEEPIIEFHDFRGGSRISQFSNGFGQQCTSGWTGFRFPSPTGPSGYGIMTAGHCTATGQMNFIQNHPVNGSYTLPSWIHFFSQSGTDASFHSRPSIAGVFNTFHARANEIRNVTSWKLTNSMPGSQVCLYGRSSNNRNCNAFVQAVYLSLFVDGVLVNNMARTSTTVSIGGDSGGGWSWNTQAWGINSARDNNGRGYFVTIQEAQNVLNATILCSTC